MFSNHVKTTEESAYERKKSWMGARVMTWNQGRKLAEDWGLSAAGGLDGTRCLGPGNTSPCKAPNLWWPTALQNASWLKLSNHRWFKKVVFILKDEGASSWSVCRRLFTPERTQHRSLSTPAHCALSSDHPRHGGSISFPAAQISKLGTSWREI